MLHHPIMNRGGTDLRTRSANRATSGPSSQPTCLWLEASRVCSHDASRQGDQTDVTERVGKLSAVVRLEVREQLEAALVERSMTSPAEWQHAVRVVTAALRARHEVSRIGLAAPTDEAAFARDLATLRFRGGREARAAQRRLSRRTPSAFERGASAERGAAADAVLALHGPSVAAQA